MPETDTTEVEFDEHWTEEDEALLDGDEIGQEREHDPWMQWAADLDIIFWAKPLPDWQRIQWLRIHSEDISPEGSWIFWGAVLTELDGRIVNELVFSKLLELERKDALIMEVISGSERTDERWELPGYIRKEYEYYSELALKQSSRITMILNEVKRLDELFKNAWIRRDNAQFVLDPDGRKSSKEYRNKHPWLGLGKSYDAARYFGKRIPYNQYMVLRWHQEGLSS
jgi:hypothetical protein